MTTATKADSQLDQDARALYGALQGLIRVYQFRDRDRICCHDLSVTQCYALEALDRRGALTMNDLSAELYLDKSTSSRVINALERKEYVERRAHPDDRRAVQLHSTRAGRALYQRIKQEIVEQEKALIADIDPTTRQAMTQLIRRLATSAAERVDTSGGSCCLK